MCQAQTCNNEQDDLVPPSHQNPPSRVGAGQQEVQHTAGEVREGFQEEVVLKPSPWGKQELGGGNL